MRPNPQETADLVTFTEESLNGKVHILRSACFLIVDYLRFFFLLLFFAISFLH